MLSAFQSEEGHQQVFDRHRSDGNRVFGVFSRSTRMRVHRRHEAGSGSELEGGDRISPRWNETGTLSDSGTNGGLDVR